MLRRIPVYAGMTTEGKREQRSYHFLGTQFICPIKWVHYTPQTFVDKLLGMSDNFDKSFTKLSEDFAEAKGKQKPIGLISLVDDNTKGNLPKAPPTIAGNTKGRSPSR